MDFFLLPIRTCEECFSSMLLLPRLMTIVRIDKVYRTSHSLAKSNNGWTTKVNALVQGDIRGSVMQKRMKKQLFKFTPFLHEPLDHVTRTRSPRRSETSMSRFLVNFSCSHTKVSLQEKRHSYRKRPSWKGLNPNFSFPLPMFVVCSIITKCTRFSSRRCLFTLAEELCHLHGHRREHGFNTRGGRIFIARRIVRPFANSHVLDHPLVDQQSKALAAADNAHGRGARMGHFHAHGLGEFTGRVAHKGDHGSFDALVGRPSLHDGAVVDTVHEDFVNPGCLLLFVVVVGATNTCPWRE
jgi:hypothetical protein